jgi:NitT/TauT family transport system substrate-binding protein
MKPVRLSLLRGVCQMPAYIAYERGLFREQQLDVRLAIEPTAWTIPERMLRDEVQFAVMPWTRVVAASARGEPLVLICGSGHEEAAIVVRQSLKPEQVRRVAIPQRGGMKDLTARGLVESLGWQDVEWLRMPSGDGAILALVGQGADAASMVEPYASMLEGLEIGNVVRRTGELWPGAPGCSLTTTRSLIDEQPELVQRMVNAFVAASRFIERDPLESSKIAAHYIGIDSRFIRTALDRCRPNLQALSNSASMNDIIGLMLRLGYLTEPPTRRYYDAGFLTRALGLSTASLATAP